MTNLKECYFSENQTICCSEEDMNPKNMKTCSLCQKKSILISEINGLPICWFCYLTNLPRP